ncbi:hypothetical protein HG537_0F03960 [Torulaspora globosa]|uniref:Uncharacterized protein n=1 Tax=Torulaspora globosa TaxID=48254 RepID=A0A7H9HYJ4_9SACH|nr:hypothetical protein HG537_0F03960 [Torulaspora sp. CBS 2947]
MASNDHLCRINYLYQLSAWHTLALARHDGEQALARAHSRTLDLVAKRTRSKLLPQLKRTLCKRCRRLLVPRRTAECRLDTADTLVVRCRCGSAKRFAVGNDRDYRTFYEKPGNLR